jgi:hypothetical protein
MRTPICSGSLDDDNCKVQSLLGVSRARYKNWRLLCAQTTPLVLPFQLYLIPQCAPGQAPIDKIHHVVQHLSLPRL